MGLNAGQPQGAGPPAALHLLCLQGVLPLRCGRSFSFEKGGLVEGLAALVGWAATCSVGPQLSAPVPMPQAEEGLTSLAGWLCNRIPQNLMISLPSQCCVCRLRRGSPPWPTMWPARRRARPRSTTWLVSDCCQNGLCCSGSSGSAHQRAPGPGPPPGGQALCFPAAGQLGIGAPAPCPAADSHGVQRLPLLLPPLLHTPERCN